MRRKTGFAGRVRAFFLEGQPHDSGLTSQELEALYGRLNGLASSLILDYLQNSLEAVFILTQSAFRALLLVN